VDVLCEGACVYHRYNKQPIEIGRLQRFAMDAFYQNGAALTPKTAEQRAGKVACIGAGPLHLRCRGASPARIWGDDFRKEVFTGWLNTYGVAEYKLRASDSLREIDLIRELGVEFHFVIRLTGRGFAELEQEFDFIFLGIGLGRIRSLEIPEEFAGSCGCAEIH